MLKQLYIKNFTLIDELNVDFHEGFSVITGETGAGKSIILGALGLLLGNRADSKAVKDTTGKCVIEGVFDLSKYDMHSFFEDNDIDEGDDTCIIRREVNGSGKSRAFINDTPVSLVQMRELGEQLIDIHSQHQNLLLQKDNFQISVIDIIAENKELLNSYRQQFKAYKEALDLLEETKEEIRRNAANADFIRFQYEELKRLQLKKGEEEELDQKSNTMQHSEDIKSALFETDNLLGEETNGVLSRLHKSIGLLRNIESVYPQVSELISRIEATYVDMKDASSEIADMLDKIDYDPDELEEINNRLDAIYSLEQKHHVSSVEELLQLQAEFEESINNIDNSEDKLMELQKTVDAAWQQTEQLAKQLTAARKKAAAIVEKEISERLKPLGLPNVRFVVDITPKECASDGADKVVFLFSANPGTPLNPISQVASGGEIARVMLALKALLSGAIHLPTIIFDEIDTGVSGRIAEQMAKIMKEMGQSERQVISITHLPQIAAMGANHYKVYKEQQETTTTSHMRELNNEERINEIAQMLSGSSISAAAIDNAKELLGL